MKGFIKMFSPYVDKKELAKILKKKSDAMSHEEFERHVLIAYLDPNRDMEELSNKVFAVMNQHGYKFENAFGNILFFQSNAEKFESISIQNVKILQYTGNIKHIFFGKKIDSYSCAEEFSFNENLFKKLLEIEYGHCALAGIEASNEN